MAAANGGAAPMSPAHEAPKSAPTESAGITSPPLKPKPSVTTVSSAFAAKSKGPASPAKASARSARPDPSKRCQPKASTSAQMSAPPAAATRAGWARARPKARLSARSDQPNTVPAAALARPTSKQSAPARHDASGGAAAGSA